VLEHGLHWVFGLVGGNQLIYCVNVCSPLLANQAVAFAKMSLSCLRPAWASSTICWRNCAVSGCLGMGISGSFFRYDKVSVKRGQLHGLQINRLTRFYYSPPTEP
jgi:hypothetical protein